MLTINFGTENPIETQIKQKKKKPNEKKNRKSISFYGTKVVITRPKNPKKSALKWSNIQHCLREVEILWKLKIYHNLHTMKSTIITSYIIVRDSLRETKKNLKICKMWTLLDKTFLEIENGETVEPFLKMNLLTKQINYKKN